MTVDSAWQHAFVLHRRPWRESSLWLEAFSREAGKVALLAKGGRRFAVSVQPFRPLLLHWRQKGEVATLVAAEAGRPPLALRGGNLYCGFYVNELVSRLLPRNDPHPVLFDAYCRVLEDLAKAEDAEVALRRFELILLREIGYAPLLDHEVECGTAIEAAQRYRYLPGQGPVRDTRGWLHGRTLLALRDGNLATAESRAEAKRLLRLLIAQHLQGRPLRSRSLFVRTRAKTKDGRL